MNEKELIMFSNLLLGLKLICGMVSSFFGSFDYTITQVNTHKPPVETVRPLQEFESQFTYPFSQDEEFTINHGANGDYFSFFKTLGTPHFYTMTQKKDKTVTKMINEEPVKVLHKAGEIAAAACGILRTMKNRKNKDIKAWYICDVKVGKKYQGEKLPLKMMFRVAVPCFLQCRRGFAVCMNPQDGHPRAADIFEKHGPMSVNKQTLNLYSLNYDETVNAMENIRNTLIELKYMKSGEYLTFKSTAGIKDYNIFNKETPDKNHPWNLLHIQPGIPNDTDIPQPDFTHMICALKGSSLDDRFKTFLKPASSTATIVSRGMEDFDFNTFTTNQI
jgi:hypothetical protein